MNDLRALYGKSILLTGATGLIGSELAEQILAENEKNAAGMRLTMLVRDTKKAEARFERLIDRPDVTLLQGDVCDPSVLEGKAWDYILHGAGNAHPLAFSQYPVETMQSNLTGTLNLLSHARQQAEKGTPLQRFVMLSSGEIYGEAPMEDEQGWPEDTPGVVDSMKERSCYPEAKRAAETLCRCYYKEYGISTVVARLGYIFGANITQENSRADAQFLRRASAGEDIVMKSEGMQLRSYCYVKDAASALLLLLSCGGDGQAYNVANLSCVATIREFAQTMAEAFDVRVVFDIPHEVEKAGYSRMKREVLNAQKLYDLGWKPRYTLPEAMQDIRKSLEGQPSAGKRREHE